MIDKGDRPRFACVGGRMEATSDIQLLTSSLQPFIVLEAGSKSAGKVRWLLDQLEGELAEKGPGNTVMCEQIMHMIFIEMIRISIERNTVGPGILSALADPRVRPALIAIHGEPTRQWKLEELAGQCNLSRSQFAARFTKAVGISPIEYLFRWRMHLARRALTVPNNAMSRVAVDAGYQSVAAFGAAYKRLFGSSPRKHSVLARAESTSDAHLF